MLSCIVRMKVSRYFEDYFDNACTQGVCIYIYIYIYTDTYMSIISIYTCTHIFVHLGSYISLSCL